LNPSPRKKAPEGLLIPFGGTAYGLIEILYRGHTHWTMLLLGGLCFYLLSRLAELPLPLHLAAVPCAYLITGLEFFTGCLVNLLLHWNVWDYSNQPLNLLGQVCFSFLGVWYLLSIPGLALARYLKKQLRP